MAERPTGEKLLSALEYFASEAFAPLDDSPKGVGPATVMELLEGGLLEDNGKSGFRTTAAGRQVLAAEIPHVALARALWFEATEAAASEPELRPKPTPPVPAKKRKSSLLVTQKQVAAVMKGAAQAGVHVEVRIKNGVVRFIPCTPEAASPKPRGVDKRTRVHL